MHDVAEEAEVSIKTVSRVVNGERNVSEAVRDRVLAAVEKLHYVPNGMARSLKVGLGDAVGVVIDSIADPFFAALTSAVETRALKAGLTVVFGSTGYDADRERRQVERMVMQRVRGVVLAPVQGDHSYLAGYRRSVPVVLVDRGLEPGDYDTVLVDDYGSTRHAVQHLVDHGHRRIAFVGQDRRFPTMTERQRGYSDCLAAAGIPEDPVLSPLDSADEAGGAAAVLRLLQDRPDVTALFCANTWAGLGAVHALHTAQRTDVAMISFGDFPLAGTLQPGVTCVDQDPRLIGEVAAEHLLSRLGLGAQPPTSAGHVPQRTILPARLVVRGSGEIEAPR